MDGGTVFLFVVIGAFSLFAGVVGFASWEEGQARRNRSLK
jgi:hypothetical protein